MSPRAAAVRCSPAFVITFSHVHVSPDRYQSTGTRRDCACGGAHTAQPKPQLQACDGCSKTDSVPSKQRQLSFLVSIRTPVSCLQALSTPFDLATCVEIASISGGDSASYGSSPSSFSRAR